MKMKWDNVSKTFSVASELSVLSKRHFKKTKAQKVQSLTLLPATLLWFLYFSFFGKRTEASYSFCREDVGVSSLGT